MSGEGARKGAGERPDASCPAAGGAPCAASSAGTASVCSHSVRLTRGEKKINQKPNQINVQLINSAAKNVPLRGGNGAGGRLAPSALVKGMISGASLLGPKKPGLEQSTARRLPTPPLRDRVPALGRAGGRAWSRSPPGAVSITACALLSNACLDRAGWPQTGLSGLLSGCRCSRVGGHRQSGVPRAEWGPSE